MRAARLAVVQSGTQAGAGRSAPRRARSPLGAGEIAPLGRAAAALRGELGVALVVRGHLLSEEAVCEVHDPDPFVVCGG
ncbi:hypothetical protein GCM10017608_15030 [Agromyces luteolus]|nr:hypothetical protein GCM10017608_15030 [Agromyces luteolus]